MSRPKAWNGTAWVDPSFWTGSQWKTYIPPVYDRQVPASTEFASGLDGWVNSGTSGSAIAWNPGGYMTMTGPGGFLQHYGAESPRASYGVEAWNGRRVRLDGRYWSDSGNSVMGWTFFMNYYGGPEISILDDGSLIGDSQWHEVSSPVQVLNLTYPTMPYEVYCNILLYGGGTCHIDYTRLVDADTGQTLLALGDPGWEPRVKRADGSWK